MTRIRCAIYTRKSSEEGLEQSFNSLDAQRESCEAYIASQKSEGWKGLPAHYDDGGFSGGNMDRPALQRLLADIAAGLVDVVVVYKVDRLTRSLADFARIVELLDRNSVSFVSVTQAFNTTSSMGRLTLNVLLSFAQFEREVTGERIRDKIAASKAKGMWMGGLLPLGYDVQDRKLIVVPEEAETVRHIFSRYLQLKSVGALRDDLESRGIRSKVRRTLNGEASGGSPFGRGALFHLLRNRIYLGEIVHKGQSFPGQHDGVVDPALFERAQKLLARNAVRRTEKRSASAALRGKIFDAAGSPMSPSHAYGKTGALYRYYVSAGDRRRDEVPSDHVPRVSAVLVEELVLDRVRRLLQKPAAGWPNLLPAIRSIQVRGQSLVLEIVPTGDHALPRNCDDAEVERLADGSVRVTVDACMQPRRGTITRSTVAARLGRRRYDQILITALKRAHRELDSYGISFAGRGTDLARASGLPDPYLRKIAPLAFLAPDIQAAILKGRQPGLIGLKQLTDPELPSSWSEQRIRLGFGRGNSDGPRLCGKPAVVDG